MAKIMGYPIFCHFVATVKAYLADVASFLDSRYTQYWFMLMPSRLACSVRDLCKLLGILSLNWPE